MTKRKQDWSRTASAWGSAVALCAALTSSALGQQAPGGVNEARQAAARNEAAAREAAGKPWTGGPWKAEYYYIDPRPDELFAYLVGTLSREPILIEERDASVVMLGMLIEQHPERTDEWVRMLWSIPAGAHVLVYYALASANTNESLAALNEVKEKDAGKSGIIDYIGSNPSPDLLIEPFQNRLRIDMLWGAFFVSGDASYVRKIIDALEWSGPNERDENLAGIGGAAYWSLTRNAFSHSRVLAICKAEAEARSGQAQTALRALITDAERHLKVSHCPEPFPPSRPAEPPADK